MRKNAEGYDDRLLGATSWLFEEFLRWNAVQGELRAKGYPNNHYDDGEAVRERGAFQAIAERFVLEDVDFRNWQWFETPWAGADANTGMDARIIDFIAADGSDDAGWGILGFYVTRNPHFWYAIPLAEMPSEDEGLSICQVNCIQDALDAFMLTAPTCEDASKEGVSDEAED